MEGSRVMVAVFFALILISIFWVVGARILNPFLQKGFLTLDDSIAIYIDTLAAVESGSVMIPLEKGTIRSVEIVFENEGKKEGYEAPETGWYVVVTYRTGQDEVKDASIISTYPYGGEFRRTLLTPEEICITKPEDSKYAEVGRC